jgi:hypothetical protein
MRNPLPPVNEATRYGFNLQNRFPFENVNVPSQMQRYGKSRHNVSMTLRMAMYRHVDLPLFFLLVTMANDNPLPTVPNNMTTGGKYTFMYIAIVAHRFTA